MLDGPLKPVYRDVLLLIDGEWTAAADGQTLPVHNPATGETIGQVARAGRAELERVVASAQRGFNVWRKTSALKRAQVLNAAAALLRERIPDIAVQMTLEQGKVLAEARGELDRAAETLEWAAGETQRLYGRVIPPRTGNVLQIVTQEPVGVVAAFSPWNFPVNQLARKAAAALAAGCAIIAKGPEETPGSCAEFVRALEDAGLPKGVFNLVFGVPAEISEFLIPHPAVRKVSFTGSTPVGKHLAAMAGQHMKRVTMELGGHAPVLVFSDADLNIAAKTSVMSKLRNAGQTCVSPTRFLVERTANEAFTEKFVKAFGSLRVGDGLDPTTQMGPLANARRVEAMERLVADAVQRGAKLRTGGERIGNTGHFFQPTVLTDVPTDAAVMNEEPFGPVAIINAFDAFDDAIAEANRLPFGLAAYAFTSSSRTAGRIAAQLESGMLGINHFGLGNPEAPFGGVKDSGYGSEGGPEAIEAYVQPRFVTQADL
ncbi:MAG TPA: NAD-dependent succinate-semialdehyde dehydrogenase [Caulobacteraceae bacterium]|nr:NAD-dependent succinate-semialdehyde dehydrogenase [Caulobacteraceae bacterium]